MFNQISRLRALSDISDNIDDTHPIEAVYRNKCKEINKELRPPSNLHNVHKMLSAASNAKNKTVDVGSNSISDVNQKDTLKTIKTAITGKPKKNGRSATSNKISDSLDKTIVAIAMAADSNNENK